jgi:hypothetical protein
MFRCTALALAAVLATGSACAHDRQLTNRDVAVVGTFVVLFGGTFALCVRYNGCGHRDR